MNDQEFVDLIVKLSKEVDQTDRIYVSPGPDVEDSLRKTIASRVIEEAMTIQDRDQRELTHLAVLTQLVMENFLLNQTLLSQG